MITIGSIADLKKLVGWHIQDAFPIQAGYISPSLNFRLKNTVDAEVVDVLITPNAVVGLNGTILVVNPGLSIEARAPAPEKQP